jgi:hypothetical protein
MLRQLRTQLLKNAIGFPGISQILGQTLQRHSDDVAMMQLRAELTIR